jgi:type II secretory ATPase GspE/PulE/Tfp pilus assembly ATPase PilB-like protein
MGIPEYLIANTLILSAAQRLVRKLCTNCKIEIAPEEYAGITEKYGINEIPLQLYKAIGCEECDFNGYKGRVGLFEVLEIDGDLKSKIREKSTEIEKVMSEKGFSTIRDSALKEMSLSTTSLDEVYSYLI